LSNVRRRCDLARIARYSRAVLSADVRRYPSNVACPITAFAVDLFMAVTPAESDCRFHDNILEIPLEI
jgi:hypothetical protein